MPADGLVAPGLVRFTVGGHEPPRCLPSLPPGVLVKAGSVEGMAGPGPGPATAADRHPACLEVRLDAGEAGLEALEPALLVETLGRRGVTPPPAAPPPPPAGKRPPQA